MSYTDGEYLSLQPEQAYSQLMQKVDEDKIVLQPSTEEKTGKLDINFFIQRDKLVRDDESLEIFDLFLRSTPMIEKECSLEEKEVDDFAAALAAAAQGGAT